jgi:hypothetical protein
MSYGSECSSDAALSIRIKAEGAVRWAALPAGAALEIIGETHSGVATLSVTRAGRKLTRDARTRSGEGHREARGIVRSPQSKAMIAGLRHSWGSDPCTETIMIDEYAAA